MIVIEGEIKAEQREREREVVGGSKREINSGFFVGKCIWEIRTDNPSLAVTTLNVTPRPILPSQKDWLEMASDNH